MSATTDDMQKKLTQQPTQQVQPQGIVNSASVQPPADQYKAADIKPVTTQVDAGKETVENRLTSLTSSGNKYVELARKDAQRESNTRGLVNSTMAGAAGVDAAVRAALPIAQQDAKTYTDTRVLNQNTQNDFLKNQQSAELNKETAAHGSQLAKGEAANQTYLDIQRDNNSAALNESLATLESSLRSAEMTLENDLKVQFEQTMNDARFSDEMKLQAVSTMNTVIQNAQQQIVDIGLSDATAAQQAAAIQLVLDNRDATLSVYQDLLGTFDDWDWGTAFTPDQITPSDAANNWNAPVPLMAEPSVGTVINNQRYQGNGVWVYQPQNNYDDY